MEKTTSEELTNLLLLLRESEGIVGQFWVGSMDGRKDLVVDTISFDELSEGESLSLVSILLLAYLKETIFSVCRRMMSEVEDPYDTIFRDVKVEVSLMGRPVACNKLYREGSN